MAYNKFKLKTLKAQFGIEHTSVPFLPTTYRAITPSLQLMNDLSDAMETALATEKAKSEHIVLPIIKELRRQNPNKFSYFSGYQFDVDVKQGLKGFCDFIFSAKPHKIEIETPIFCFVEAKKDDIDAWFGQCAAEMYAAQLLNEKEGTPQKVIYGCVTNAFSWAFLKLEGKNLSIDPNYVPLTFTEPQRVLAVLQWILERCLIN
jgi:hypothetical protein